MIDPVTAAATAASAFKALQSGFAAARSIESMASDLQRWMGALSDLDEADRISRNPPLFKQLFSGQSIEAEAASIWAAKRNAQQQRDQLRQYVQYTLGQKAWSDLVATEAKIRKDRKDTLYKQAERRRKFIEISAIILFSIVTLGFFAFMLWLYIERRD